MKTEDTDIQAFKRAARFYEEKIGVSEIASNYVCTDKYIYMVINGHKEPGRRAQLKFAKACGFDTVAEFIASVDTDANVRHIDPITRDHLDLVKNFVNKKIAYDINKVLVDLDNDDSIRFGELAALIRKFANGAEFIERSRKESESNQPDRRTGTGEP
jgi:hypothetical protein